MTLRKQIMLMAILPLCGLVLLGTYLVVTKFSSFRHASDARVYVQDVDATMAFIHVLQAERGLSAGFVSSGGTNFADTLPQARRATDALVERLPAEAEALREGYANIAAMRSRIDGLGVSVADVASLYTGVIRDGFAYSQDRIDSAYVAGIARLGAGLTALNEAKEAAGLQRAAGAAGFGAGVFDLPTFRSFIERGGIESGLMGVATVTLPEVVDPGQLAAAMDGSGIAELRDAVVQAGAGAPVGGISAQEWFAHSTAWIEELRVIEQEIVTRIGDYAAANQRQAGWLFGSALVLSVLSLVATVWIAWKLVRSFDAGFTSLTNALLRLGNGEFDGRSYNQDNKTEIGRLFIAIDDARDMLSAAQDELDYQSAARNSVIDQLDAALVQLSEGNLGHRLSEPFASEFESLRASYNASVEKLGTAIEDVQQSVDTLHNSSSDLTNSNDELSMRTASQAAALEETTAALAQLSEMVSGSAASAGEANAATTQLNSDAISGAEQVEHAIKAIQEIAEATNKMSGMIGLIEDIAFQTSLLALNAGVEAARAGEAGKGFAVVASEVRALAVRATETTVEIKTLIGDATDRTSNGVALVEQAGEVFASITESVSKASSSVGNIASDAEAQASSIDEIKSAMFDLDRVTQENAAMVDGSLQLGEHLQGQANDLRRIASQFYRDGAAQPHFSTDRPDEPPEGLAAA